MEFMELLVAQMMMEYIIQMMEEKFGMMQD